MASKNLGAVIQRAISDGAFRRQLQADPAAALRGFNLTPNEIAAIRSGDPSKLTALGVDQRVSKAFTVGGGFLGATRSAISDMGTGATSNGIIGDPVGPRDALTTGNLSGTRAVNDVAPFEGNVNAVSDPTISGTRSIHDTPPGDLRSAVSTGDLSGTRAVHDSEPADIRSAASIGDTSGTRAVHDSEPFDSRSAASTGDLSGTRAIHDTPPFGTSGTSAVEDPNAPEFRAAASTGDVSGTRAVHDTPPFEGNASVATPTGDPYSGQYIGVSPDFQANLGQAASGTSGPGDAQIAADDNYSVSSRMADANMADATRSVNDVAPFDSGTNTVASGNEFIGGDIQHDPGDVAKTFTPSDSADVQREMLDGLHDGGALGNTGGGGNTDS